jgi:hypothetical protein
MAIEKFWPAVPPQLFTADGTTLGVVTIGNTAGFKVKQNVTIQSTSPNDEVNVQVKRVLSSTQLIVGPVPESLQPPIKQQGNTLLSVREDISNFTTASGAFIYAGEQPKVIVPMADIVQAVYRQEPGTTIGVEIDDQYGNPVSLDNPLPVVVTSGSGGGTIPTTWSDIKLAYDSNNNLIQVQFYSAPSVVERTLTLSYDSEDNLIDVLPS